MSARHNGSKDDKNSAEYVLKLLEQDAKNVNKKFAESGSIDKKIKRDKDSIRPSTTFLRSLIHQTTSHNRSLLKREKKKADKLLQEHEEKKIIKNDGSRYHQDDSHKNRNDSFSTLERSSHQHRSSRKNRDWGYSDSEEDEKYSHKKAEKKDRTSEKADYGRDKESRRRHRSRSKSPHRRIIEAKHSRNRKRSITPDLRRISKSEDRESILHSSKKNRSAETEIIRTGRGMPRMLQENDSGGNTALTRLAAGERTMEESTGKQMMDKHFTEDYDASRDTLQVATIHPEPTQTLTSRFRPASGNPSSSSRSTDKPARLKKASQQQRQKFYLEQENEIWSQFPAQGEMREWDKTKKTDKDGNVYHVKPFERWK